MNITTPPLSSLATPVSNMNTEAARRDNVLRETIPQSAESDKGRGGQGLGADSDRARQTANNSAAATYERPATADPTATETEAGSDKSGKEQQESAGREHAEQEQQAQKKESEALEKRDREVRTHEQAHSAAGGQYASSPSYEYTTGPDNKRYVTHGEVSIDTSEATTPAKTVQKMEQVRQAALAPVQPSAQDMKVASDAGQAISRANSEMAAEKADDRQRREQGPLTSHIERIQYVYHQAYTPKSAGFQTSA
ncbi:hypothetical protein HHX48_08270 [Salinimonas sp. HHU 13199]|uniref:Catalase n=1 Tax=Salinimonas profundi TaxID=2729140 RepID=A0ABR8LNP7_9ALTE|nr:putative metalloprotease CJM1_0395 family protein [Salinimonas profundi]MBD3585725.1 hypothetical protein [Salinimonas profundi]